MVIESPRYSLPEVAFSVWQRERQWVCGVKLPDDLLATTDEEISAIAEWRALNRAKYYGYQASRL